MRGGGGWCGNNTAPAPIEMYLTKFSGNAAATGGGLYAHGGCRCARSRQARPGRDRPAPGGLARHLLRVLSTRPCLVPLHIAGSTS